MRAVLDTNVLLSALLWGGSPHALLKHVRDGSVTLISSPALLNELAEVFARRKFDAMLAKISMSREQIMVQVRQLAEVVDPQPLLQPICRDPDDDAVLALAIASRADWMVSADADLLSLGSFEGIPIVTPAQALLALQASL